MGFFTNPGRWVIVTPISQKRKQRYREGQGQAHLAGRKFEKSEEI